MYCVGQIKEHLLLELVQHVVISAFEMNYYHCKI
jgi:hypothetical protein